MLDSVYEKASKDVNYEDNGAPEIDDLFCHFISYNIPKLNNLKTIMTNVSEENIVLSKSFDFYCGDKCKIPNSIHIGTKIGDKIINRCPKIVALLTDEEKAVVMHKRNASEL
jgi:hypothetical protein